MVKRLALIHTAYDFFKKKPYRVNLPLYSTFPNHVFIELGFKCAFTKTITLILVLNILLVFVHTHKVEALQGVEIYPLICIAVTNMYRNESWDMFF